jgi:hypothetical protein
MGGLACAAGFPHPLIMTPAAKITVARKLTLDLFCMRHLYLLKWKNAQPW